MTLSRKPVTHILKAVPSGRLRSTAELQVRVDGQSWQEVENFLDSTPSDLHYVTTIDENDFLTIGFGTGQPSRQDAVDLACRKAGERARASVLASDGFFPFPDAAERAAEAGVTAIIQPGGSTRDPELIRVANRHGMAMIFTGERHYRH